MKPKTITLCADDFGYHAGVSEGILQLLAKQRLSAVSCMVNGQDFLSSASQLALFKGQVALGLHLNLTEGSFLSTPEPFCYSLPKLLLKTHCWPLDTKQITKELEAQWESFIARLGSAPDFIDGHQHVHQLPQIRRLLLDFYTRIGRRDLWIRATYPLLKHSPFGFKTAVLALTGGRALQRQLQKQRIPQHISFGGVYDFDPKTCYRTLFQHWLAKAQTNSLLMCHPGVQSVESDPIAVARQSEFDYLMSADFIEDCQQHQVVIGRPSILKE